MDPENEVQLYRDEIDRLDDQIIALLRARVVTARDLGYKKYEMGIPIRNSAREIEVSQKYKEALGDLGLTVGNAIIKQCWQVQTST